MPGWRSSASTSPSDSGRRVSPMSMPCKARPSGRDPAAAREIVVERDVAVVTAVQIGSDREGTVEHLGAADVDDGSGGGQRGRCHRQRRADQSDCVNEISRLSLDTRGALAVRAREKVVLVVLDDAYDRAGCVRW